MLNAAEKDALQRAEDLELAKKAAMLNLAEDMIKSAVRDGSATMSKSARAKEIAWLTDPENPCYVLLDVGEENIERIAASVEDNTLEWVA